MRIGALTSTAINNTQMAPARNDAAANPADSLVRSTQRIAQQKGNKAAAVANQQPARVETRSVNRNTQVANNNPTATPAQNRQVSTNQVIGSLIDIRA